MSVPTFAVGTGRCGSAMLSNMLREHPRVLSLSEFYSSVTDYWARVPEVFSSAPMDGGRFWLLLSEPPPRISLAFRHGAAPETLYPPDDPKARFCALSGVPAVLHTTLPHLTDEPDRLFDLLQAEVTRWPAAVVGDHYRRLFGWLAERFGKRLWIERSGSTFGFISQILATFPEARFVHIVRDGRDAALSMHEHLGFRFGLASVLIAQHLGVNPIQSADRTHIDRVPEELRPLLPERLNAEALRAFDVPLPICAGFWTQQIGMGLQALGRLPAERLLTLRYEDFLLAPKAQLETIAAFLGDEFVDDAWSTRCAAMVRPPRSTWRDLAAEDSQTLTDACRAGFEQLRAVGMNYDDAAAAPPVSGEGHVSVSTRTSSPPRNVASNPEDPLPR